MERNIRTVVLGEKIYRRNWGIFLEMEFSFPLINIQFKNLTLMSLDIFHHLQAVF